MADQNGRPVLVVEDDADVRDALEQVLSEEGYRVHTAQDGVVALEVLEQVPSGFCLIILDVLMPRIDGQEFLDRARDRLRDTPVLLFAAGPVSPELLSEPCVVGVLPKPVDVDWLLQEVRTHCRSYPRWVPAAAGGT
jgi:CheY-like chemotaxis protein